MNLLHLRMLPLLVGLATTGQSTLDAQSALVPQAGRVAGMSTVAEQRITLDLQGLTLKEALRRLAKQANINLLYNSSDVPDNETLTISLTNAPVLGALRTILRRTDVVVRETDAGFVLEKRQPSTPRRNGGLVGRVVDAETHAPIQGARITVLTFGRDAIVNDSGRYRMSDLPVGSYRVAARRIGYERVEDTVTITDDADAVLDFALRPLPNQLDQVVVTGTITPTAVKALPTPITVLTSRDLERAGVTRVDDILRGTVPGAVKMDVGTHDGYPGISFRGGLNFDQGYSDTPAKVYVDGVEMAYTNALSQVDPKIIDHIEITRGPQASTIYGAGAIAGVIQIFTKKGTAPSDHPEINAQAAIGGVQSQWRRGSTLRQDHSVSVAGGAGEFTYSLSGAYASMGAWAPEYKSENKSYFASARRAQGSLTLELTGMLTDRLYDIAPIDPYQAERVRSGQWHTTNDPFYANPFYPDASRQNGTLGLNASYASRSWWQHRLSIGYDGYENPNGQTSPRHLTSSDTLRRFSDYTRSRASLAYNTTLSAPLARSLASTLTLGAERWYTHESSQSGSLHADGLFVAGSASLWKAEYANTGIFAQTQFGWADALFLTAGVRADWNDNFGTSYGAALAPRIGIAYTGQAGPVLYKARVAYGKAIRPPLPYEKQANLGSLPFSEQEPSPNLGPESQSGYDGGIDLYFGARTSLQATYYDQRVDHLISTITLSAPEETTQRLRYENLGRIANTGWELQGSSGRGPFTVVGTYSIYNSTVKRVAPAAMGDERGQYHLGDRILLVPRSVAGMTVRYDRQSTNVSLGATYLGSFRNYDMITYYNDRFGPNPNPKPARTYLMDYPASIKWNAGVSQSLSPRWSLFGRVENAGNSFASEMNNISAVYGRQTLLGLKTAL